VSGATGAAAPPPHVDGPVIGRAMLRKRISASDARYAGDLVEGAHLLQLFGDLATELSIRHDGDEGLMRAYDSVEFLAPVQAGDYIDVYGALTEVGRSSRRMAFEAYKSIVSTPERGSSSAAPLDPPLLVARAIGVTVTPVDRQRGGGAQPSTTR
jgi:3-aminobutyryl-CoA ammonia-lyase